MRNVKDVFGVKKKKDGVVEYLISGLLQTTWARVGHYAYWNLWMGCGQRKESAHERFREVRSYDVWNET